MRDARGAPTCTSTAWPRRVARRELPPRGTPEKRSIAGADRRTSGHQAKLHDAGYAGFTFPVEYGGQGLTWSTSECSSTRRGVSTSRSTSSGCRSTFSAARSSRAAPTSRSCATPEDPRGRGRWLQFLSEPSGGSDLAGLLTPAIGTATLRGQRPEDWSTGAHLSDFALCPVRTRWDVPKHKGSPCSSSTCARRVSSCAGSSRSTAAPSSARSSSPTWSCPPRTSSAKRTKAGGWPAPARDRARLAGAHVEPASRRRAGGAPSRGAGEAEEGARRQSRSESPRTRSCTSRPKCRAACRQRVARGIK